MCATDQVGHRGGGRHLQCLSAEHQRRALPLGPSPCCVTGDLPSRQAYHPMLQVSLFCTLLYHLLAWIWRDQQGVRFGSLHLQLVCRRTLPHVTETAHDNDNNNDGNGATTVPVPMHTKINQRSIHAAMACMAKEQRQQRCDQFPPCSL